MGLSQEAERVYRVVLADATRDVAAVAAESGFSPSQLQAAFDELVRAGFAFWEDARPCGLRAVTPDVAMELVLSRQQLDLAAQQLELERSRAAAAQFIAAHSQSTNEHSRVGEFLAGIEQIRHRLVVLADEAESTICTFAPGGAHSQESIDASREPNRKLLSRGIISRTVYLDSVRNDPLTSRHLAALAQQGAHVRTAPTLPTRPRVRRLAPATPGCARSTALMYRP